MLTLDKVFDAQNVLKDIITTTSLQKANRITDNCTLYLKPECLQKTGSFKLRGSGYKIAGLSEEEKKRGVVACSAGNHSQGVALAATKLGIPSYICMPDGAPISKVEATKSFGAQVTLVNGVYDDAYRKALEMRDEFGYTLVHPLTMRTSSQVRALSVLRSLPTTAISTLLSCPSAAADLSRAYPMPSSPSVPRSRSTAFRQRVRQVCSAR